MIKKYREDLNNNYVLILTSNSKEKKSINNIIKDRKNIDIDLENHKGCYIGKILDTYVIHLSGTSGISDSSSISRLVIVALSSKVLPVPSLVVLIGFCWGNPKKVKIKDTIISTSITSYNNPNKPETHNSKLVIDDFFKNEIKNNNIHFGSLVSLEKLIVNEDERDSILQKFDNILGGEMEAFGFIPSLRDNHWLVIKNTSDYADENFSDHEQSTSVDKAVDDFVIILEELNKQDIYTSNREESIDINKFLLNNSFRISRNEYESSMSDFYLNDYYGPVIDSKLSDYYIDDNSKIYFQAIFTDLILEIAENSFEHTNSSFVQIDFHPTKFTVKDNGTEYNLNSLEGEQGGARCWKKIYEKYIVNENVVYSYKKNLHTFKINSLIELLVKAKQKCNLSNDNENINFDKCKIFYLDATKMYQSSKGLIFMNKINKILCEKKVVYIECSNQYTKENLLEMANKEYKEYLHIYISKS